jgi:Ca-activated chloride channel homolog
MSWFTNPIGLFAFAAIPAVIALHLFRRRHQELPVSSLFLWLSPDARESSGRRRQPLRRTPSFWLELAAALIAALFLSGFNPLANADAVHLIVVLDDSASMSAGSSDGSSSVHQRLTERLEQEFDKLGRRTRVSLIRSGVRPTLLCGPGALIPEAREALRSWHPTAPGHDPRPAMSLARELALGHEIWYLTDRDPGQGESLGDEVRVIGFGAASTNAALIDVRRQSVAQTAEENGEAGDDLVSCNVRLYGAVNMPNQLEVVIGGEVMVTRQFELEPGKDLSFQFPLPPGTPAVQLRLQPDAILVDNSATLYPNPDRTVAIGFQLDDGLAEHLRLADFADALPAVRFTPDLSQAHLVFAHDAAPQPAWSLVLPHEPGSGGATDSNATSNGSSSNNGGTGETTNSNGSGAEAFLQGFLPEKRHPLLRGMTFEGMLWSRARNFTPLGLPLLSVGSHALIGESVLGRASVFMVNLLPLRSTLAQSPDWPILVSNLVELRRASLEGPRDVNLVAGQAFEYLRQGRAQFLLNGGTIADKEFASDGNLRIEDLPPAANYLLTLEQKPLVRFAVNFMDPAESNLADAASFEHPPKVSSTDLAQQDYAESPMGRIFLLLLTALLLADWLYLGRRSSR